MCIFSVHVMGLEPRDHNVTLLVVMGRWNWLDLLAIFLIIIINSQGLGALPSLGSPVTILFFFLFPFLFVTLQPRTDGKTWVEFIHFQKCFWLEGFFSMLSASLRHFLSFSFNLPLFSPILGCSKTMRDCSLNHFGVGGLFQSYPLFDFILLPNPTGLQWDNEVLLLMQVHLGLLWGGGGLSSVGFHLSLSTCSAAFLLMEFCVSALWFYGFPFTLHPQPGDLCFSACLPACLGMGGVVAELFPGVASLCFHLQYLSTSFWLFFQSCPTAID